MNGEKKPLWIICIYLALAAFTIYISLDTFVIGRSYNTNAVEINTSMFENLEEAPGSDTTEEKNTEGQYKADTKPADPAPEANQDRRESANPAADGKNKESAAKEDQSADNVTGAEGTEKKPRPGQNNPAQDEPAEDEPTQSESDQEEEVKAESEDGGRTSRRSASGSRNNRGFNQPGRQQSAWGSNGWSSNNESSGINAAAAYTGPDTYQDDNVTITLKEYNENDTQIYVADVTLTSAQYLKTAFANDTYGKNVTDTTSSIAESNNAIFAVNGDYYGAQERGFVIRNGIVYRDSSKGSDVLCIYADGTMGIVNDRDYTADQLVEMDVWQAFTFGPALIQEGIVTVGASEGVGREMASNPRTAIGIIDANHYIFVVSDGRTDESEGLSLYELAEFMQKLGVQTAYNLDGGGSSTMYFNGQVVNNPTSTGRIQERSVSDIVYIGKNS